MAAFNTIVMLVIVICMSASAVTQSIPYSVPLNEIFYDSWHDKHRRASNYYGHHEEHDDDEEEGSKIIHVSHFTCPMKFVIVTQKENCVCEKEIDLIYIDKKEVVYEKERPAVHGRIGHQIYDDDKHVLKHFWKAR